MGELSSLLRPSLEHILGCGLPSSRFAFGGKYHLHGRLSSPSPSVVQVILERIFCASILSFSWAIRRKGCQNRYLVSCLQLACLWILIPTSLHPQEENHAIERAGLWSPSDLGVSLGDKAVAKMETLHIGSCPRSFLSKTFGNSSSGLLS